MTNLVGFDHPKEGDFYHTSQGLEYIVHFQDSRNMDTLKDKSVDLIITSPPYYNLKDYSTLPKAQVGQLPQTNRYSLETYQEYLKKMDSVWKECDRVLKDDGVIFLNSDVIKHRDKDKNIIPLPFHFMEQLSKYGLGCKDVWIYKKLFGVPFQIGKKLKNRHEYLLVFSKTNNYKWNLDDVREPYPQNYIYPPGHRRRNPIGSAPSSVWEFYPPSQSGGRNHYHYCPFPNDLVDRAIKLFTDKNDVVLDPFCGSGSVVARAKALCRNGIGYEINRHFETLIKESIDSTKCEKNLANKKQYEKNTLEDF